MLFASFNSVVLALSEIDPGKYESITVDDKQNILNEINVSLDTAGTRPTEVKGLLLTRNAIMNQGGRKTVGKFTKLIQFAKTNHLPIYILDSLPRAKL